MMAALMLLTACGQTAGSPATGASTPGSASAGAATASPEPAATGAAPTAGGAMAKFDPPVTISLVRTELTGLKYPEGDNIDNNEVYRTIEQQLGIKIVNKWVCDPTAWDEKRNLMISSGDLPDLFEASPIQFMQLNKAGSIQPLTAAFDQYASPDTKRILNEGGEFALKSATVGGQLMGLPYQTLSMEGVPSVMIRKDWLQKVGKSEPANWKEMEDIAVAFARDDPDGNGKNDTWGFAAEETMFDTWSYMSGYFFAYHSYPRQWLDINGSLAYGGIQPEVRTALQSLQTLYKNGGMSPEFNAKNKPDEEIASGKAGILTGAYWNPLGSPQACCDNLGKYDGVWECLPLTSVDDKPLKLGYDLGVQGYHVVRKGYEHPEAAVMLMNFWMQTFYINTDMDVYYKLVQDKETNNAVWQLMPCESYRVWKNLEGIYWGIRDVQNGSKQLADIMPEAQDYYKKFESYYKDPVANKANWSWTLVFDPKANPAIAQVEKYREADAYLLNMFYGAPTDTMTSKWQTLQNMQRQAYNGIIAGGDLGSFDSFVTQWKSLGGDQITKEVNDWYATQK